MSDKLYKINDYVVCTGHGVAQVERMEDKELRGTKKSFYILKVITNGMTLMVPTDSEKDIRPLSSKTELDKVYELLSDHEVEVDNSTWNRRYRNYMQQVKTGSVFEIADVLRSLYLLKGKKTLCFGERKMLEFCKTKLMEEISLSLNISKVDVEVTIAEIFEEVSNG